MQCQTKLLNVSSHQGETRQTEIRGYGEIYRAERSQAKVDSNTSVSSEDARLHSRVYQPLPDHDPTFRTYNSSYCSS